MVPAGHSGRGKRTGSSAAYCRISYRRARRRHAMIPMGPARRRITRRRGGEHKVKTVSIVKAGLGGGAALLLAGFVAAPAQASSGASVPCSSAALSAAITAANTAGGGTINLASGCHYALTSAVGGEDGLPPIGTAIGVNGNGATIDGTGSVRVLEVDSPGNLSLQNVTITGGSADIGGGIANLGG